MRKETTYWSMKYCLAALAMAPGLASATLVHQYTFNSGGLDSVGGVNGSAVGESSISAGLLNLNNSGGAGDGLFNLDGSAIAINTYANATIELWATPSSANGGFATLFSAGAVSTENAGFGANYFQFQPHRGDDISRAAISIGNETDPWTSEDFVDGTEFNDDMLHYYVVTVADVGTAAETMSLYEDGSFLGSVLVGGPGGNNPGVNTLSAVSQNLFRLGNSYPQDPFWIGTVDEFNVYDNVLDLAAVQANFATGPVPVPEPSIAILGGLGVIGLLRRRRIS